MATTDSPSAQQLQVKSLTWEADDVLTVEFVAVGDAELIPWQSGAHLDIELPSGLRRQYSLCGDPRDLGSYRVSVLRQGDGRGGSLEIHDTPLVGRILTVHGPKNFFPLIDSDQYLFLAGGIGITPIVPMLAAVEAKGATWRCVYGGRSRTNMAFVDQLLCRYPGGVDLVPEDERGLIDLEKEISRTSSDTEIYCCGPAPMIAAVEEVCERLGRASRLHIERFGVAQPASDDSDASGQGNSEFIIELKASDRSLSVPADRTILDVVRDVMPDAPSSCEEGFCGSCETRVISGDVEHRDTILSEQERQENRTMMICVSRATSAKLVIDL